MVEAGEGPLLPGECTLRGGPCRWEDVCAVHPAWVRASTAIRESLAGTTLAELAAVDRDLARGINPSPGERHRSGPKS